MNKCKKCLYEWEGKKDAKACPRCKRYDWRITYIKKLKGGVAKDEQDKN